MRATPLCLPSGLIAGPGATTFRNLDGYLEAALMPERTFYGVLGLFYLFLGLFWMVLLGMFYKVSYC
jgi:hypothetical protein